MKCCLNRFLIHHFLLFNSFEEQLHQIIEYFNHYSYFVVHYLTEIILSKILRTLFMYHYDFYIPLECLLHQPRHFQNLFSVLYQIDMKINTNIFQQILPADSHHIWSGSQTRRGTNFCGVLNVCPPSVPLGRRLGHRSRLPASRP